MEAEYRVLGPLEVLLDGEPVTVPAGRCHVLLATLLLRANQFVPVDELVDQVWDGEPPSVDRAHKTLQMVVRPSQEQDFDRLVSRMSNSVREGGP